MCKVIRLCATFDIVLMGRTIWWTLAVYYIWLKHTLLVCWTKLQCHVVLFIVYCKNRVRCNKKQMPFVNTWKHSQACSWETEKTLRLSSRYSQKLISFYLLSGGAWLLSLPKQRHYRVYSSYSKETSSASKFINGDDEGRSPKTIYNALVKSGSITPDPNQMKVVDELERLHYLLHGYEAISASNTSVFSKVSNKIWSFVKIIWLPKHKAFSDYSAAAGMVE